MEGLLKQTEIPRDLDLSNVCDGNMLKLVTSQAQALGVPRDYIFLPLLAGVSAYMGQSIIRIHDEWTERCILWCVILGKEGSKRTTTLNRIAQGVQDLQTATEKCPLKLFSGNHFSLESFLNSSEGNLRAILGLYENIQTDLLSGGDCNIMKNLYDVNRVTNHKVDFSLASFIMPKNLDMFVDNSKLDFISRALISCPKPVVYKSGDYKTPMPSNTPSLKNIFAVLQAKHQVPLKYVIDPNARKLLDQYYDTLAESMRNVVDTRKFCALSKAAGQLVRVSGCMAALRQALKFVVYKESLATGHWGLEVNGDDMEAAKLIVEHSLRIKLGLVDVPLKMCSTDVLNGPTNVISPDGVGLVNRTNPIPRTPAIPPPKRPKLDPSPPTNVTAVCSTLNTINGSSLSLPGIATLPRPHRPPYSIPIFHPSQYPHPVTTMQPMTQPLVVSAMPEVANSQKFPESDMPRQNGDIPRDLSTVVGDVDLMFNEVGIYDDDINRFVEKYSHKIRKVLEFHLDYRISPSVCAQRHLMPPLTRDEMSRLDTNTRYPVIVAREYLAKIARLGFGTIENVLHQTNNRRSMFFQKKTYDELSDQAKDLLYKLQVDVDDYMAAFNPPVTQNKVDVPSAYSALFPNGSPVLPELSPKVLNGTEQSNDNSISNQPGFHKNDLTVMSSESGTLPNNMDGMAVYPPVFNCRPSIMPETVKARNAHAHTNGISVPSQPVFPKSEPVEMESSESINGSV